MQLHLLREEPVHSGSFIRTGETIEGDADAAMLRCVALSADGNRYAVYPYEAIRNPTIPAINTGADHSNDGSSLPYTDHDRPVVVLGEGEEGRS